MSGFALAARAFAIELSPATKVSEFVNYFNAEWTSLRGRWSEAKGSNNDENGFDLLNAARDAHRDRHSLAGQEANSIYSSNGENRGGGGEPERTIEQKRHKATSEKFISSHGMSSELSSNISSTISMNKLSLLFLDKASICVRDCSSGRPVASLLCQPFSISTMERPTLVALRVDRKR